MYKNPQDVLDPVIDWERISDQLRALCGVSESTVKRWRRHPERMPQASRIIANLLSCGHLGILWPELHGWVVNNGRFCTWCGRHQVAPGEIEALDWYKRQIRRLQDDLAAAESAPAERVLQEVCESLALLHRKALVALSPPHRSAVEIRLTG